MSRDRTDTMPPDAAAVRIGCTVYYWGVEEQDRLLVECIGPLTASLRHEGLCRGSWFNRFDARGPHVYVVFSPVAEASAGELGERVSNAVRGYVEMRPSQAVLAVADLEARHAACRGKVVSEMDRLPGYAENNTVFMGEHGPAQYPYFFAASREGADRLGYLVDDLCAWALDELARVRAGQGSVTAVALRWLVGFDRALAAAGLEPRAYWRHHAKTLLPGLDQRLAAGDGFTERALLDRLGPSNLQALERAFRAPVEPGRAGAAGVAPGRLLDLACGDGRISPEQWWPLAREVLHMLLNQLGLPVAAQVPIVLYAWLRDRDQGGGG